MLVLLRHQHSLPEKIAGHYQQYFKRNYVAPIVLRRRKTIKNNQSEVGF